ncbi:hypothetical protein [Rhizobium sp. Root483D2]|uniref:hypothetical protein n=1 Tax=Rhizobium sp. Root483D2 TaxID=1736545 RepID=UPI0007132DDE|nr:hypothetical protein [Rhizobium sp. Root483D2]KQY19282.1 hypothetical protein ASD32_08020 [Rhizobium sp. Root483D2]
MAASGRSGSTFKPDIPFIHLLSTENGMASCHRFTSSERGGQCLPNAAPANGRCSEVRCCLPVTRIGHITMTATMPENAGFALLLSLIGDWPLFAFVISQM